MGTTETSETKEMRQPLPRGRTMGAVPRRLAADVSERLQGVTRDVDEDAHAELGVRERAATPLDHLEEDVVVEALRQKVVEAQMNRRCLVWCERCRSPCSTHPEAASTSSSRGGSRGWERGAT